MRTIGMTPSTPVLPLIYALRSKLDDIKAEGADNRYARHQRTNKMVRDHVLAKGFRLFPAISSLRLRMAGEGLSVGLRATDRLSLGIGLRQYQSSLQSITRRFLTNGPTGDPDYSERHSVQSQRGNHRTFSMNAGLLFDVDARLSVGATLRRGFSFPIDVDRDHAEYLNCAG